MPRRVAAGSELLIHYKAVARLRAAGMGDHEFFHCPNEGKCSKAQASRRKAMGVNAGVPDFIFLRPAHGAPGRPAALEIKKDGGRLTDAQKLWLATAAANGWTVAVEKGEEAVMRRLAEWGYIE